MFYRWINIAALCKKFEYEYLLAIHKPLDNCYLKTDSYYSLVKLLDKEEALVIKGPKGVGKSFSLIALMAEHSLCCLLFTQESFGHPGVLMTYLNHHLECSKFLTAFNS